MEVIEAALGTPLRALHNSVSIKSSSSSCCCCCCSCGFFLLPFLFFFFLLLFRYCFLVFEWLLVCQTALCQLAHPIPVNGSVEFRDSPAAVGGFMFGFCLRCFDDTVQPLYSLTLNQLLFFSFSSSFHLVSLHLPASSNYFTD